jgi:nucleotide-binding universal stress UspA family protein
MAHISQRLRNSLDGALAGGGDPASSPLYVFGPFLKFLILAGVARVTFGASVWLVVLTVAVVSLMYRQVIGWVTDGTGGSGLTEEEFGAWAVKVNSGITFVEYTLTFLVSVAALVTLIADRVPLLDESVYGLSLRTVVAVALSISIGYVVNRGPRAAAWAFGPATLGVLLLLWAMIAATIWRMGFRLPDFKLEAFEPRYLRFTLSGFSRLLALMTGIEVFANLVAAYEGTPEQRSRMAFRSLLIAMGTTCATMLIVGPAIFRVSNPVGARVSVFTQAMDRILPSPLPYLGTVIGIVVLGSAAAASAQGLQNLALGLRYRHYVPARMGQRNGFDVADLPVWIEVSIACICYTIFGTQADIYLSLYAVGVFVLLSMTGWAAAKRTLRNHSGLLSADGLLPLGGAVAAALLTSAATVIIFVERFTQGAWAYFLLIPAIYLWLSLVRGRLGEPVPLSEHLGRLYSGQYLLPFQREARPQDSLKIEDILVPLDGSPAAEEALAFAEYLCRPLHSRLTLLTVDSGGGKEPVKEARQLKSPKEAYLERKAGELEQAGVKVEYAVERGQPDQVIAGMAKDMGADLIAMTMRGRSGIERLFMSDVTERTVRRARTAILLIPAGEQLPGGEVRLRRILVALDGSRGAESTLRYARMLAEAFASELLLLGVPEADSEGPQLQKYLDKVAESLRERNLRARTVVTGSGPGRTIAELSKAEDCDMAILARSGRGEAYRRAPLGSVAARAVQTPHCPLLLVDTLESGSIARADRSCYSADLTAST